MTASFSASMVFDEIRVDTPIADMVPLYCSSRDPWICKRIVA